MGLVHKVVDARLEREVAVKTLRAELADDRDQVRRFTEEARTTGQLQHPAIPPVFEFGRDLEGRPYMALQLVQGETLAAITERLRSGDATAHNDYPFARRIQLTVRVCEALEYAHSQGWLHRDVKPENIMVGRFGEVYLMDWGLAKRTSGPDLPIVTSRGGRPETRAGIFTGTPEFASPEQIAGQSELVGPQSDIYSLGAVLYEFMTLKLPHHHEDLRQLISKVLTDRPVAPENVRHPAQGRVPREVSLMILRAMAKEPAKRYPSVAMFRADLVGYLENEARPVCPHTTMKSFLFRINRLMDNHPYLSTPLVYAWLTLPLWIVLAFLFQFVKLNV